MLPWFAFAAGIFAGGLVVGLWMRARIVKLEFAASAAAKLGETFQALADASLRSNQGAFLDVARSTLETVRAEMTGDLRPLNDSLDKLQVQVRELELAREKVFGSLGQQLQSLAKETLTLSAALRSPQARGRWGEITLRRVAELSGMVKNCDFLEQETCDTGAGRIRPDMIVRLPGGRSLVVDAKVPLTAYLDAVGTNDEADRKSALARHGRQLSEHVRQLSGKQYWAQFRPAPELVVLFLPGDHFFSAALETNPALIEDALACKVVIATPVTLISVLKGISYGWTQERLAENAEEIRRVAAELYDRAQAVFEHYADTGRQLEKTVECYNRSVGSWDSRLAPALRRMRELGVAADEPIVAEPIDIVARRPRAVGGI